MAVSIWGCADHGPDDTLGRSVPAAKFAMAVVSRTPSPAPGGIAEDLRVSAFFVRHVGFNETEVLDLINLPDAPEPMALAMELGGCQLSERNLADGVEQGGDSFIDLIDAGDLRINLTSSGSARIQRNAFPDLFSNIGGVTYELSGLDGATSGLLQLTGRGSRQVGRFAVSLDAVPIPILHSAGGQPITSNYAAVDWREPLDVEWAPSSAEGAMTFIELAALQYDRIVSLQCRARDTGLATLPRAGVEAVGELAQSDATVRLSVRRLVQEPFHATGMQRAHAFFVARDSVFLK